MTPPPFVIYRPLRAPRPLVWDVYSQADHLQHWFGPKGVSMSHSAMDFRVGGTLLTIQWEPYEASASEQDTFLAGHSSMNAGWSSVLDRLEEYLSLLPDR